MVLFILLEFLKSFPYNISCLCIYYFSPVSWLAHELTVFLPKKLLVLFILLLFSDLLISAFIFIDLFFLLLFSLSSLFWLIIPKVVVVLETQLSVSRDPRPSAIVSPVIFWLAVFHLEIFTEDSRNHCSLSSCILKIIVLWRGDQGLCSQKT